MDHNLQKLEAEVHSVFKMQFDQMNNATVRDSSSRVVYGGHGHSGLNSHKNVHQERKWTSRRSKHHEVANVKRGAGATFTWFHPGPGACGGHQTENDYIIAISHLIFDGGSHCGDTVTITYKGKTVQATVRDKCMGCDANHIDLSPGLLRDLAGPGVDQVTGEWFFGSAPAPPPEPKPEPKPTTHSTPPPPPPTTTTRHHYTTSTSSHSSTTTSTSKSTSSSSTVLSSTVSSSSSSASPSATPALEDDGQVHNFQDLGVLIHKIGGMAISAALVRA
ncbi:hypothetical protein AGABI2DRAFT_133064 [Agaricus bisporus var. bisporus H97]|uniref:hypothetical protein n=1 Tax=Agaricus bisporus var. bisporus (strain H97 / ATCC MYA-4626 / FGSC 10389) TaxID=936046 RepID=UPI00029F6D26|nr:hypothetical protein AGABI2DRAFT_133064 [Agaricus bisporus var. bisporus H97]EKV51386.1 hypothetical protein AGABI2DRAFT_133064 [Agaricus bisporus var. bisporus H97]